MVSFPLIRKLLYIINFLSVSFAKLCAYSKERHKPISIKKRISACPSGLRWRLWDLDRFLFNPRRPQTRSCYPTYISTTLILCFYLDGQFKQNGNPALILIGLLFSTVTWLFRLALWNEGWRRLEIFHDFSFKNIEFITHIQHITYFVFILLS